MSIGQTDKEAAAHAVAPRVALADIERKIADRYDVRGDIALLSLSDKAVHSSLKLLSMCLLVMENGFVIVGISAPASPENFSADLGKKFAYENAVRQLWPLEGYLLRQQLVDKDKIPGADRANSLTPQR